MSTGAWELVFMMFILKLPIVYLIGVVVWAIRAAPDPFAPATTIASDDAEPPGGECPWRARRSRVRPRPRPPVGRRRAALGAR